MGFAIGINNFAIGHVSGGIDDVSDGIGHMGFAIGVNNFDIGGMSDGIGRMGFDKSHITDAK